LLTATAGMLMELRQASDAQSTESIGF